MRFRGCLGLGGPLREYERVLEGSWLAVAKKTKPVEALNELEPMLTRLKLTAIRDQPL